MGTRFTVEMKCAPKDRRAFDRFLDDRIPTVSRAQAWLKSRGFRIARSCVHSYMVGQREKSENADEAVRAAFRRILRGMEARQRLMVTRIGRVETKTDEANAKLDELAKLLKTLVNVGRKHG